MKSLSGLEEFFYYRSKQRLHTCFIVAITLNTRPTRGEIFHAIKTVVSKYPQLYSDVVARNGSLVLDPLQSPFSLDDVVEFTALESLDEESSDKIFKEITFIYGTGKPLWKVLVLEDQRTFVLCSDHVILDGLSTTVFWGSFMRSLNASQPDSTSSDEVLFKPSPTIPHVPQHPYSQLPVSVSGLLLRFFVRFLVLMSFLGVDLIGPVFVPSLGTKDFKFLHYRFPEGFLASDGTVRNDNCQLKINVSPNNLRALLRRCKEKKVSLSVFLLAVIAHSLKLVDATHVEGSRIKASVPMNTRPLVQKTMSVKPEAVEVGNFITGATLEYDKTSDDDIWQTAAKFREELLSQKDSQRSIESTKLLELIDVDAFVERKKNAKYPGSTFEVTNLGFQSFDCGEDDRYYVQDSIFNNPQGLGDVISCGCVATPVGGLNCSINFPRVISSDLKAPIEYIKRTLDSLSAVDSP
ncbi:LAQU0S03e00540g1_1 [Lachancea quebecensis]|uniref:LAQU0S03e00540g1_1 n=1 Tax=Lachancea quebecensis TaxID=1654605 RepID=A0A0P1KNG0_9SACH|nr:LAQU0S03e00540g1_1 [Lachancea quebecensis]